MKRTGPFILIVLFILTTTIACRAEEPDTTLPYRNYPVPEWNPSLMFYLQRSHNRNTVIYELNFTGLGTLNPKEPLRPSWIRFEEKGIRKELSSIQKRVFGLDVKNIGKESWIIRFRSYKKREVYLFRDEATKSYKALIKINGKMVRLTHLFLSMTTNAVGVPSSIKYVDLHGIDQGTHAVVMERIIP